MPAEEMLREDERKARAIFEISFGYIGLLTPDGIVLNVNKTALEFVGVQLSEVMGKPFWETPWWTHTPETQKWIREAVKSAAKGILVQEETTHRAKDGKLHIIDFTLKPVLNENGQVTFLIPEGRDITQRKQAEEALKQSEEKFRQFTEKSLAGIYIIQDGKMTYVNPSLEKIFGYSSEEIIGKLSFENLIHPDDIQFVMKRIKERLEGKKETIVNKLKAIKKDGSLINIEVNGTLIEYQGRPAVMGTLVDVTERMRTEEALIESERHLRSVITAASIALWDLDCSGTILLSEGSALAELGMKAGELVGQSVFEFNKNDPEALAFIRRGLAGEEFRSEVQVGGRYWSNYYVPRRNEKGNVCGLVCVSVDITERKQAQEALHESELLLYEAEKLLHKRQLEESEEKYRELFENANDAIFIHDINGFILTVNYALYKIFECATKDEVIGTNISSWLTPESLKIAKDIINKFVSLKPVKQPIILEVITKNKKHLFLEFRNRVIKDNDRITAIHGIARDITENRLLKQELKKSNKQQKLLYHLIQGTRGGKTRALIMKHLSEKSYNAHQLATVLDMDYTTIRHHLKILIKNGIIGKVKERSSDSYFISNNIDFNFS